MSKTKEKNLPDEDIEGIITDLESENGTNLAEQHPEINASIPEGRPIKRAKKRVASEKSPSEITMAIQQLDKIAKNAAEEKPFEQFGRLVASELRFLPQREAILLQQEIQNCITRSKLNYLDCATASTSKTSHFGNDFSSSSNTSTASLLITTNENEDLLQNVMSNTFGNTYLEL